MCCSSLRVQTEGQTPLVSCIHFTFVNFSGTILNDSMTDHSHILYIMKNEFRVLFYAVLCSTSGRYYSVRHGRTACTLAGLWGSDLILSHLYFLLQEWRFSEILHSTAFDFVLAYSGLLPLAKLWLIIPRSNTHLFFVPMTCNRGFGLDRKDVSQEEMHLQQLADLSHMPVSAWSSIFQLKLINHLWHSTHLFSVPMTCNRGQGLGRENGAQAQANLQQPVHETHQSVRAWSSILQVYCAPLIVLRGWTSLHALQIDGKASILSFL